MAQVMPPEAVQSAKKGLWATYVVFAFCCALVFGFFKGLLIGPIAALVLIIGNVGVIVGLLPAHVYWTVLTLVKTNLVSVALKVVLLFTLPIVFMLWLALGIVGSVLVGLGYGFVAPWMATFDAFRLEGERNKFVHCIVILSCDESKPGWNLGTIKGSCTVTRDFADFCYHSVPLYMKELRAATEVPQPHKIRFVDVPACILVAITGVIVDLPLYTIIAVVKSPYMLFKGWQRLMHDLISGEGPFRETSCVPIAGLAILFWPLVVVACERSLRRGLAYVVATVAEFDEYTNDWLHLSEGTIFPRPQYRKRKASNSSELSIGSSLAKGGRVGSGPMEPPALLVPSLAPSRSVREVIHEVKMVQIWDELMTGFEVGGKQLLDAEVITLADLSEWVKMKGSKGGIIGLGLPSYCLLDTLVESITVGASGIVLSNGAEVNHQNRPQDRLLDWFFHPVMVLKEQIRVINLEAGELRFLEKLVIFGNNTQRMESWNNGSVAPQDAMRNAQIQAISRRLVGMTGSISKFPTYRRRFERVVKVLIAHSLEREPPGATERGSIRGWGSLRVSKSTKAMHAEV
ncbi:unnamed protein product [Spirodela intermedia]|uniref:Uncharacterized protein n=1 Tax=Spirodela intermedia TaxID=51605 RepID=A0A7I8J3Z2_SPIIN|nr:unnamed protein product [Spirodela intermedia]CAA6664976.1 unnamed protein product [Spirodela intermedia]